MNGMEILMKQMGIDPGKIMRDFETLKNGVLEALGEIRKGIDDLRKGQEEIKAWQNAQQKAQQNTPLLLPTAQQEPNQPPSQQQPPV